MAAPAVLLAAGSGLSFALIGIALRAGSSRGLDPLQVFTVLALVGAGWFACQWAGMPPPLALALGLLAGVTQYAAARLFRAGLALGPLTPLWGAMLLSFLEPVAWAALVHGQRPTGGQWWAMALAVAAVAASAGLAGQGGERGGPPRRVAYLGLLALVLVLNGVANVSLAEVQARGWQPHWAAVMVSLYLGAALPSWLELRRAPARLRPWRQALPWGLLGAAGSIGGLTLLALCIDAPAGLVFTVQAATSIVGAAVVGVVLFSERTVPAWWAMVVLVLAAVAAAGLG
jgi:multidrug transporter EmrE-like cation transporter